MEKIEELRKLLGLESVRLVIRKCWQMYKWHWLDHTLTTDVDGVRLTLQWESIKLDIKCLVCA